MLKTKEAVAVKPTLGQYLASIRADRKMSLRQVEQLTDKQVSNAYLSQIENDKIKHPSPNILYALAEIYEIDYENLMEKAGHIRPTKNRGEGEKHGCIPTFAEHNLTPEEETELMNYLKYIRSSRKPSG